MKKILCVLLVVLMCLTAAPLGGFAELDFGITASALNATGKCGENANYTFDSATGKLVISGTGAIAAEAFYHNLEIKNVIIDDGITEIGADAFNQSSISNILIGNDVTVIGNGAFWYCYNLTSIDIPDNIISIGDTAFGDCNMLASVNIGDGVTTIGDYAFASCSKLTTIEIGDSITTINTGVFHGCDCLANVYYAGSAEEWNAINIKYDNNSLNNATIHFAETHTHTWDVEEITKYPTCTEKGEKVIKCKNAICEKLEEIPATGHEWIHASCTTPKTCNKCGVTEGEALGHTFTEQKLGEKYLKTPATCEKKAVYYYSCSVCGLSSGETNEAKTFEYGTAPEHNWGPVQTVPATCTEPEMKVQTCSRCGQKYAKKGSGTALGHSYGSDGKCKNAGCTETCPHSGKKETIYGKPATCTNPGVSDGEKCKDCGVVTKIQTVISALGHKWDSGVVTKDATCMEYGEVVYKCINTGCGETKTNVIEKLYHDYKEETTEPTCDKDGYTKYTCTMCGSYYIDKAVKALGHSFTKYVSNNDATCTDNATEWAACDRGCGAKDIVKIPGSELGHEIVTIAEKAATCTEPGITRSEICYRCKRVFIEPKKIPALGHLFTTEKVIIKAPTCTAEGKKAIRCERCHAIEPGTEEVIPATHNYPDNWSVVISPDCQNTGFAVKVCFSCHDVIAQKVPKAGHADLDGDSKCDTCEMIIVVEPEEPTDPDTPNEPEEKPCDCDCHAGGIKAFFFKLINFFAKIFDKSARVCKCGASH